jgi:hypothetical protein
MFVNAKEAAALTGRAGLASREYRDNVGFPPPVALGKRGALLFDLDAVAEWDAQHRSRAQSAPSGQGGCRAPSGPRSSIEWKPKRAPAWTDTRPDASELVELEPSLEAGRMRGLWAFVLGQALQDASGPDREARGWPCLSNRDFREVCHMAGLDPEYVLRKFREVGGAVSITYARG